MNSKKKTIRFIAMAIAAAAVSLSPAAVNRAEASTTLMPEASGTVTYGNAKAAIDASHTSDGYLMIKYTGTNPKVKIRITKDTEYTYNLNSSGNYETFPLSEGSGDYNVKVYENISGNTYAQAVSQSIPVTLADDTKPFLYPNQFVNFTPGSAVVAQAETVTAGISEPLKKLDAIYEYTIKNFTYDTQKAKTVQSGYLPDLDSTLHSKNGICFDFASLMTAMLRSQGIPTKLIVGYADDLYHAWVSIYVDGQGWIENIIYFDGTSWVLMDPTFASSANNYVPDPSNYHGKFTY